jgi:hypothetical protein
LSVLIDRDHFRMYCPTLLAFRSASFMALAFSLTVQITFAEEVTKPQHFSVPVFKYHACADSVSWTQSLAARGLAELGEAKKSAPDFSILKVLFRRSSAKNFVAIQDQVNLREQWAFQNQYDGDLFGRKGTDKNRRELEEFLHGRRKFYSGYDAETNF